MAARAWVEGKGWLMCNLKTPKCPKNPKGHRYVGKRKCAGCPEAFIGKAGYGEKGGFKMIPLEKYRGVA